MARQPTLAEILADETGKIRPEIADLLMEANPGRVGRQPRPRPVPQREIPQRRRLLLGWGWILAGIISLWIISSLFQCQGHQPKAIRSDQEKGRPEGRPVTRSMVPAAAPPKREVPEPRQVALAGKKGRVVGDNVYLREQPGLNFPVIRIADRDEILKVLSFRDGWYEVLLDHQKSGFIFGAFLLPFDFDGSPFLAATTRGGSKILIKRGDHPDYYEWILANGQRGLIKKDDVSFYP